MTDATTSFDVRIWKIRVRKGARKSSYVVRWLVAGEEFQDTFASDPLADAFRSELVTAVRKGEAFSTTTGLPASMAPTAASINCYDFAVQYVDSIWATTAAHSRRNIAKTLMKATIALLRSELTDYDPVAVRTALREYAFNKQRRNIAPPDAQAILRFAQRNSPSMAAWEDAAKAEEVFRKVNTRLDGKQAAASSIWRHRNALSGMFDYAIKRGVLTADPTPRSKRDRVKMSITVDRRSLINPGQAAALLGWVREQPRTGRILYAFYATMYYAGLRPEEATALRVADVTLPGEGADDQWGDLLIHKATSDVERQWTDTGKSYDERHLKGRAEGDTRTVPSHPELTRILREEIKRRSLQPGDLVLRGLKGAKLHSVVIRRMWNKAREAVLAPHEYDSTLGKRVYDLRHVCLTRWLNKGIPPAQVAEWAGNSVPVLLSTYAHCIEGQMEQYKARLEGGSDLPSAA